MNDTPALVLDHVARRFGTTVALDDASLTLRRGTVHALLGENGAGKTTLMRIAFGLIRPDRGSILVAGRAVRFGSPAAALAVGIGMVHQHFTRIPSMTVTENVALGGRGRFSAVRARRRVAELQQRLGFTLDPDARAGTLSVGEQQRLEILMALGRGARTLILDEPTAVLAPSAIDELLATLRRIADDGGSVVLITHKLPEALRIADDVTVLRHGRTVLTGPASELTADALAHAMLGSAVVERVSHRPASPGHEVLAAGELVVRAADGSVRVRDVSLAVRSGEILGIAGVEGAGQHELLLVLAGRLRPARGTLRLPDRIGFIPEDRHRDALVLGFSLAENIALRDAGRARGTISWASVGRETTTLLDQFDVHVPGGGPDAPAFALSGGNQQRLVLARELAGAPQAVIAENPTRGLDIAATSTVHRALLGARDAGAAVVLYSSDLDEVLAIADRLIVLFAGRSREVPLDRSVVGRAMLGVA